MGRLDLRRALAMLLVLAAGIANAAPFSWPGNARIAVSLGYDDALASQLDIALPALDARGLKGTFYLTLSSPVVSQRLAEWRQAAARGHELANHSLFHACARSPAGREWVLPYHDLDRIDPNAMRDELLLANAYLRAIDGRSERTFTAPCADRLASGKPYLPLVADAFVGAKMRFGRGVTADVTTADPLDTETFGQVETDGAALIRVVDEAAAASDGRALMSFTFHGVGGDYIAVPRAAHEALLDHLAKHPERFWVAPFVDILRHVRAAQNPR